MGSVAASRLLTSGRSESAACLSAPNDLQILPGTIVSLSELFADLTNRSRLQ